jgi:hypothetical protein
MSRQARAYDDDGFHPFFKGLKAFLEDYDRLSKENGELKKENGKLEDEVRRLLGQLDNYKRNPSVVDLFMQKLVATSPEDDEGCQG